MKKVNNSDSYKKRKEQEYKKEYERVKKCFKQKLFDTGICAVENKYTVDLFRDILKEEEFYIYWYQYNKCEYITYLDDYKTDNIIDNIATVRKFGIPIISVVVFIGCMFADCTFHISLKLIINYLFLLLFILISFYMITDIIKETLICRVNKNKALKLGRLSSDKVDELIEKGETVYYVEKENRYIISKY